MPLLFLLGRKQEKKIQEELKEQEKREQRKAELIAERDTKNKEREDLVAVKSNVSKLISSLEECIQSLDIAHEKICLGIECGDSSITAGIDKIATYKQKLQRESTSLSEIVSELEKEITDLDTRISQINSELGGYE